MNDCKDDLSESGGLGLAIDIGTSSLTVATVNLEDGSIVAETQRTNPQNSIGYDVITRARYASQSESNLEQLATSVRQAIRSQIEDLLQASGIVPSDVSAVVACGNTVMQRLFLGQSVKDLLIPPYQVQDGSASLCISAQSVGLPLSCDVFIPPIIRSFIGSDALAALLAAGSRDASEPMITIDVGTNTEVSVTDGQIVWMASAPSGPAFEGMSIDCGMPATNGAIYSVKIGTDGCSIELSTIGDAPPRGLCGTGGISLLAELRRRNLLNEVGSLNRSAGPDCVDTSQPSARYIVTRNGSTALPRPVYLSQVDIRMLQQSKAALRATLDILLKRSGLEPSDIRRVYLTGAFGSGLNMEDAYDIGLFPVLEHAAIVKEFGGVIKGAARILSTPGLRDEMNVLASGIAYVELMDNNEFEEMMARSQIFSRF